MFGIYVLWHDQDGSFQKELLGKKKTPKLYLKVRDYGVVTSLSLNNKYSSPYSLSLLYLKSVEDNSERKREMSFSEAEAEKSSIPTLPLFSIPPIQSPEPSGTLTPPLHSTASVPFRWEEEPGRPRAYPTISKPTISLDLPPRLLLTDAKVAKLPSPTTVLEGPDTFRSFSFRIPPERRRRWSFGEGSSSPERGSFLGSWKRRVLNLSYLKGKREGDGVSFVLSYSSVDGEGEGEGEGESSSSSNGGGTMVKLTRVARSERLSSQARSHFWVSILFL